MTQPMSFSRSMALISSMGRDHPMCETGCPNPPALTIEPDAAKVGFSRVFTRKGSERFQLFACNHFFVLWFCVLALTIIVLHLTNR